MSTLTEAPGSDVAVHAWIRMRAGILTLRDAVPTDMDAYVNYWHYSGEEIKNSLGIDRTKLGTPEDSAKRFLEMIRVSDADQPNILITITLNDEVVGYTNVNRHSPDDNYVHMHTYRLRMRSALKVRNSVDSTKTGAGVAVAAIGLMMNMYFNLAPVRRLVLQTRTTNRWINRALDLYMPPAETRYLDTPAGLAAPSEYYLRYIYQEDALWMLKRVELINKGLAQRELPGAAGNAR